MAENNADVLVAEVDVRVVGSIVGGFDGWRGNIYRLAVHPRFRRRGVARALVVEIESRLRARCRTHHGAGRKGLSGGNGFLAGGRLWSRSPHRSTCAHSVSRPMSDIATLLASLVKIPSINPSLVPGAPGEAEIARWVRGWLEGRGVECQVIDAAPGRSSVIGRVPGRGGGRSLLLNAHLDTVGVAGMADPFAACIRDGRLYGRGAFDMKGSLAACMLAVAEIRPQELAGDVILTAVADEEHASLGIQSVLESRSGRRRDRDRADEPSGLRRPQRFFVARDHDLGRGRTRLTARSGGGCHRPYGPRACAAGSIARRACSPSPHPLLGHASVHASMISGGQELSSYPARCVLELERRTLPGETTAEIEGEFAALLTELKAGDDQFQAQLRTTLVRPPFCVARDCADCSNALGPGGACSAACRKSSEPATGWTRPSWPRRAFRRS